ncbi:MAG TPA: hypothetical protein VGK74_28250 [Symbiobacteriaceae bacterium]|jgi:hypothetical protein
MGPEGAGGVAQVIARLREMGAVPLDAWHVAALLEMEGWSDEDARRLDYPDLFALARAAYSEAVRAVDRTFVPARPARTLLRRLATDAWRFLRGVMFAMPMVISGWASLAVGLSLWAYAGFDVPEATGIAIAVLASFLATGGFTQAMSRRGLFLISLRQTALARRTALQFVAAGILWAAVAGIGLGLVLMLVPVLRWETIRMALLYYPYLCLIWLFLGLLYMLQREFTFTAVVAAGIGVVYLLVHSPLLAGLPVHTAVLIAHAVGLTWCAAMSGALALWFFARRAHGEAPESGGRRISEHWPSVIIQVYPFFLYGLFYFAFLFTDRVLAWSVPGLSPQALWFTGRYESGMTWASLALLLPMGVVEVGIHRFVGLLFREQPGVVLAARSPDLGRRVIRLWRRLQTGVIAAGALAVLLTELLMHLLVRTGTLYVAPLLDPVSGWVFGWAAVGYVLLAGGLLNVLMLFITNQPWPAVRATVTALAVSLAVGFVASRFWYRCFAATGCTPDTLLRYPQAAAGLVAGALVFWWLSGRAVRRALDGADYLLYLNA